MKIATSTALIGLLLATVATGGDQRFDFDVLLDSRPVGTHSFQLARSTEGAYQVTSQASFNVKFLGIVVYRYRHKASEHWAQGCLSRIDSSTDDNGKRSTVRQNPPGCVSSYAYWDRDLLLRQRELLNPQTGERDPVQTLSLGEERIMVRGAPVIADHYQLRSARFSIDLWYSRSGEWLQLDSTTDSSRRLHYRLAPVQR